MKHARKLGLAVSTALGLGLVAPGYAEDATQYAPQSDMSESSGTPQQLTVIVTEPSLVFSDGSWYTFVDGTWYGLEGAQWQSLTDSDASSESTAAAYDGMADDYAYGDTGEVWYVWVPVSYDESLASDYDATAMTPAYYDVELTSANGVPIYSYENGQWYVLAPMATDDVSHVVYLY